MMERPVTLDGRRWLVLLSCRHWLQQAHKPAGPTFMCRNGCRNRERLIVAVIERGTR